MAADTPSRRWLLFLHHLPPSPSYLRVKAWRRLKAIGAIAVKQAVYVLPDTPQSREDLQWLCREVVAAGGDASVCAAELVEGLRDQQLEASFNEAREADYRALAEKLRSLAAAVPAARKARAEDVGEVSAALSRVRRQLADVVAVDFFGAAGRGAVEGLLGTIARRLDRAPSAVRTEDPARYRDRTWVTRRGVHVDRIASAWLIRRFIDPAARFKFVAARGYEPDPDEIRFDMSEAEFTHEGERCTVETLVARFGLRDAALRAIAEIVHDIDLKDAKFSRPETPGIDRLIAGIALGHREDERRVERGGAVLDDLYAYFGRKRTKPDGAAPA